MLDKTPVSTWVELPSEVELPLSRLITESPPGAGLGPALARLSFGSNLISVEFFSH